MGKVISIDSPWLSKPCMSCGMPIRDHITDDPAIVDAMLQPGWYTRIPPHNTIIIVQRLCGIQVQGNSDAFIYPGNLTWKFKFNVDEVLFKNQQKKLERKIKSLAKRRSKKK